MDESEARRLIREHFESAMVDEERSAAIYADDAVIEFPQSGERIRGRKNIVAFRSAYPARVRFEMYRTIGSGNLWVNEYTVRYIGGRAALRGRDHGVPGRQGGPRAPVRRRGLGGAGLASAVGGADSPGTSPLALTRLS